MDKFPQKITREDKALINRRAFYLGRLFCDAFRGEMLRELQAGLIDRATLEAWVPADAYKKLAVVRLEGV